MSYTKKRHSIGGYMKTKTIRVRTEDAFIIEQRARVLSADMERDITVGEVFKEMIKDIDKIDIKDKKKPR